MTKDLLIALMGPTGTGKSTFINLISNSKFQTSAGLKSCTAEVQISQPFGINETRVQLVDTPGFDDTHASDADILGRIAGYLASSFEQGLMLSGVIYMHRITDYKIGGVSRKNFNMFRQLCGAQAMCNVIIVTNMWNLVNRDVGEARERELMSDELLFKPVLDAGAKMIRHDGTAESARRIVSQFFRKEPTPLRIQQEIVTEGKDISHTAACQELDKALATVRRRQQVELADLEKQMEEAILEQDRQTYEELELCRAELQKDVMRVEAGRKRLSEAFLTERIQSERQLQELVHMIEEQARAVGARNSLYEQAEYRHRQRIAELQRQLQIVQNAASRTLSEVASETSSVGGTEVTYTLVADEATAPASVGAASHRLGRAVSTETAAPYNPSRYALAAVGNIYLDRMDTIVTNASQLALQLQVPSREIYNSRQTYRTAEPTSRPETIRGRRGLSSTMVQMCERVINLLRRYLHLSRTATRM